MEVYIFTAGRASVRLQHTLRELANHCTPVLVVQDREANEYIARFKRVFVLPSDVPNTLPAARQYIARVHAKPKRQPKILMLDDDLSFAERRKDDLTKFQAADGDSISRMLAQIERSLDRFAHVGLCSREGGNRFTENQLATRMSRVLAYNLAMVPKDVKFDRVLLPEDFDVTLQLLYRNFPNLVLAGWCHNQPGSNTAGGCSTYRTIEVHNEWMRRFGELHPKTVKIVEKQTKTSWGGEARLDAFVQWKKALAMGEHAHEWGTPQDGIS